MRSDATRRRLEMLLSGSERPGLPTAREELRANGERRGQGDGDHGRHSGAAWRDALAAAVVFWAGRHLTFTLKKLRVLSFIHYARWAVIRRFPDAGGGERLHSSYLLFESNFNGTWDQYIDAFSAIVPARMKAIWGTSFGFPGAAAGRAVQGVRPPQ